jgi:formate hydrogenlyase subunit 4
MSAAEIVKSLGPGLIYIILGPVLGGLIAGVDRIITARMQGRVGPPVMQPFSDVFKLFEKRNLPVNPYHSYYPLCYLVFQIAGGVIFFCGDDILLAIFATVLANVFLIIGAYASHSPYSFIGAQRELLQMLAAEPALLLSALGLYMVTESFNVGEIIQRMESGSWMNTLWLLGVLFAFLFVFPIKLRKSPFDLSTSHHAHQELVKGVTTEFSGSTLALFEIAHWYETVFLLGVLFMFFARNIWIGIAAALALYFVEILCDNSFARFKYGKTLAAAWIVTAVAGIGNLAVLHIHHIVNLIKS